MSNMRWQDLLGGFNESKTADTQDDETTPLNFQQLASVAAGKEASEDESEFYSSMFAPAKTSVFHDFFEEKQASIRKVALPGGAPGMAPAFAVGDEVSVRMGASDFKGTVEAIDGDQVTISKGKITKTVPIGDVKSLAEIENKNQEIRQRDDEDHAQQERAEQDAATQEHQERVKRLTQSEATGTYDQLANYLMSAGYKLKLDVSDAQLEEFSNKYQELSGEELNATSRPKADAHANKGGWTVEFADTPVVRKFLPWPIDVERTGLSPRPGEGNERAVTNGKTIKVRYNRPVWELIARGLRYTATDDAQEVRVSSLKTSHKAIPRKGDMDYARLKIAIQNLHMPNPMKGVMGGPSDEEAKAVLAEYGLVWDEAQSRPVAMNKAV